MNTENIIPYKFSVHTILYNKDGFTVAYGKWENGPSRLAMRWNATALGFPSVDGCPAWFHLPEQEIWSNEILKALMKIKTIEMEQQIKHKAEAELVDKG